MKRILTLFNPGRLLIQLLLLILLLGLQPGVFLNAAPLTTIEKDVEFAPGGDVNNNGLVDPGDVLRYTVDVTNSSGTDMTNLQFTDTIDANTTLVGGSVQVSPVAADDSFTAQRDTVLNAPAPGFLANDTLNGAIISAPPNTAQGGNVVLSVDGSFIYTPPAGFFSPPTDSFTYTLTNSTGVDTATVTLTVLPPAPNANADSYTALRNTTLNVPAGTGVLFNDSNIFGGTVTAFDATSSQGGTVNVAADGSFTYIPPMNFISPPTDTFTYTVTNAGGSDTGTVTITVNPPAPNAVDDTYNATENTTLTVSAGTGVLFNDTDLFGGTVTAFDAASTQGGTVNVAADGSFTYDPPANFVSPPTDTFTYTVTSSGGFDTATVTITVSDLPAANADSYTATRNTQLIVPAGTGVLFNDTGLGISITAYDANSAQGGTVNLSADGSFTYDPPADFVSPPNDSFTYTIANLAGSAVGTVTITVNPPAPNAVNDSYNATEDTVLNVPAGSGVLFNDTNLFGGTVTAFDATSTRGGTVNVAADGSFTYTPPAGTISPPDDTFTYTVTNAGGFDTATVTIIITDIPAANSDSYTAAINTPLIVPAGTGVLFNDTGTGAAVTAFDATSTQGGTVNVAADGSFTYTPPVGFSSPPDDTFTYTISNIAGSDTATVTITVIPPPTANADSYIAGQDTQLVVPAGTGVLFNDTDLFGGTVTAFDATSAQGGTVNVAADGSFTYDPPTGFISPPDDTFTYTVTNGAGSDIGTVTITVIPPPEANNDTYSAHGNLSIVIPDGANDLLANDVLNGAVISAFDAVSVQGGQVSVSANGSFVYIPPPGFEGADTFTYTLDNALTDTATVTINVSGMIWFIDSSASPGGLGTFNLPFNSLSAFNTVNNGTANNPAAGDRVFIYQRGTTYTGGINLLDNQQLIGQGEDLSALVGALPLGSPTLPGATTNPSLTNNSGPVISLDNGNDIRGVNTVGPAGDAITGNNTIGGTFQNITISGATSSGIFLNGTPSGTFTFASNVTIDATTTGIPFFVNGGNANITFSGNITKTDSNTIVYIASTTGGTITFQTGTLSATNGEGIYLDNVDGTVNFNGTTTLNGGNARVRILNGSSGSFTFGTGTTITNPTESPFSVTSSNPTVTYSGSMSKSSVGTLVSLTTVSSGTITFQTGTLSATGGEGILLDNADGTVNFNGTTTLNGGNARVRIQNGSAGTVNFASATITNPTGTAFTINGSSPSGTYTGSISKNNAGLLVDLTNVSGGTYTFAAGGTLSATSGDGLLFNNADGTVNFSGTTTLNGGSARVRIEGGSSGTFNFSNGTITNPTTGAAFQISASSPSGTFNGNISATSNYVLEVSGMTAGSYAFTGGTLSASGGSIGARIINSAGSISAAALTVGSSGSPLSTDGLTLTTNTGTFTFTALNIHTTGAGNNAILGATAGTINSSSGAISSSGAAAIDINGATLGMTLTSVNANGGPNGISIQSTTGSFTVAGTGAANSGGTIQNMTSHGINLVSTAGISLTRMLIQNNDGNGIYGSNVNGLTVNNTTILNNGDSDVDNEGGMLFSNLLGTSAFNSIEVAGSFESNTDITNTSGTLNLTVSNSTFRDNNTVSPGNNGLGVFANGSSNVTVSVTGSSFLRNRANGAQFTTNDSGTMDVTVSGSTFTQNNIGVSIAHNSSSTLNYDVLSNTLNSQAQSPINLNLGFLGATMSGSALTNTINGVTTASGPGMRIISNGTGTMTNLVTGNNISGVQNRGIEVIARDGSNRLNITLLSNTVTLTSPLAGDGIFVSSGATSTDTVTVCADIAGNTVSGGISFDLRVRQRFTGTTFILADYLGSGTNDAAVASFLIANNPASTTASADHASASGFTTAPNCPQPVVFGPLDADTLIAQADEPKPDQSVLRPAFVPALSGETVSTSINTLPAGDSVRIIFDVTVDDPLPAGVTQVCNQGTISGLLGGVPFSEVTDDPNTGTANDATCSPVIAAPIMSATKTANDLNGGSAVPGDQIEYTITVANSGNQDAGSVTLTDPIPADTTYVAGSTTLNGSPVADLGGAMPFAGGGQVNSPGAAAGDVEAGQSAVIVFRVAVNDPFPAGVTTISNQGTISGVGFTTLVTDDPGVGGAADPTVTTIIAGLTFTKDFLTDPILTGETSTLQFTITNPAGNPALTNLAFTDDLPLGLVYVAPVTTPQCGGTVSLIDADSLAFSGGSLGTGLSDCVIEVTVESDGAALNSLTNTTSPLTADGGITAAPAVATIFIGVPPTATPTGSPTEEFAFPTPPATPLCVDENFNPNSPVRASVPDSIRTSVFCRLLVQNSQYITYFGFFITNPAQIGLQSVLDSSVTQAVDVFSPLGPQTYPEGAMVCLRGTGTLLFLSANQAPRSARVVEGYAVDDFTGYTCVTLYEPGTLVLIPSSIAVPEAAAAPVGGVTELTDCSITTQYIVRLRAEPNTTSEILDRVPYLRTLEATGYVDGWYRVIYGVQQGWISETLLTTAGNCG